MTLPPVIFEGSVKTIRGTQGVSPYIFEFSDRYSVFDWGAMPDQLENKGDCLAYMAWLFFDILGDAKRWEDWKMSDWANKKFQDNPTYKDILKNGVRNHCVGLVDENNLDINGKGISKHLAVKAVNVYNPTPKTEDGKLTWDYTAYSKRPTNSLVPLEVIFRFGVPAGSSLMKRVGDAEYLKSLGLENAPVTGEKFDFPVLEYSTKLETTDRYITQDNAVNIASLTPVEKERLDSMVSLLSLRLKDIFSEIGIELWDGKFELAFSENVDEQGNRYFVLVDSIGPDELRLTYKGVQLSKESIRYCYRSSLWYKDLEKAKELADERGEKDWKKICIEELKSTPPHLDKEVVEKFSMMYKIITNSLAEKFYNKKLFETTWDLDELITRFQ